MSYTRPYRVGGAPLPSGGAARQWLATERLFRPTIDPPNADREKSDGGASNLARGDQIGAGVDSGGNLPGDQGESIAFHQVHEPSGQRVRYEKVVPGIGPVDRDEILKGYEVSKGEYVLLDPEEIEKVKLESRKTLELTQFVDLSDIDPIYYDKPYYVIPADDLAEEAFVVLRNALGDQESRHWPACHRGDRNMSSV